MSLVVIGTIVPSWGVSPPNRYICTGHSKQHLPPRRRCPRASARFFRGANHRRRGSEKLPALVLAGGVVQIPLALEERDRLRVAVFDDEAVGLHLEFGRVEIG